MLNLTKELFDNLSHVIMFTFLITRLGSFKKIAQKESFNKLDVCILGITFGIFGILGTVSGIQIQGAIANTRNVSIMAGGILCGPAVGMISSLISSAHRYFVDPMGITTIPCIVTTISAGIVSGIIHNKSCRENQWMHGVVCAILIESISMILILIISKPYISALYTVKSIYLPMMIINGIGIAMVILIMQSIFEEKEQIASYQAKIALEIANKTLPYFRNLNPISLKKICEIINESIGASAVVISDKKCIKSHYGLYDGIIGNKIMSEFTKMVLSSGEMLVLNKIDKKNIYENENLKSLIVLPLKEKDDITGTLTIYFKCENKIGFKEKALAEGLSQIISTQIEISKMEKLKKMANKAEIRALQRQINPHFLFNTLNTIVSFVRIDPSKARNLIINLSTYLRYNMEIDDKPIDIYRELEQVRAYIDIEKARFSNKLNVEYDIDEKLLIKIPNLIIQPLVENSIKHGILKRGYGSVKIIVKKTKDGATVRVIDDGIGINQETIDEIYNCCDIENKIGLSNVNERLKIIYGKGLDIRRLESGTCVGFELKGVE